MRIAVVTNGYGSGGGVPTITNWLAKGLSAQGHAVAIHDLSTSRSDPLSRRVLSPRSWLAGPGNALVPATDRDFEHRHWGASLGEFEPSRYRPRSALTEELASYDVVQVVAGAPCWANVVARVRRPRVLQVATTTRWERASRMAGMSISKRLLAKSLGGRVQRLDEVGVRAMDHVVVENELMLQWVRQQNQHRVSLIPPGIDTSVFCPRGRWNPEGPIVAVGRLGEARKGWSRLFRSYAELVARRPDAPTLVLVGKGELSPGDEATLRASPAQHRVQVRHDLAYSELIALLQQASVFVQTSFEEGLGLAGLEAMACGLPMVATDTAGTREYLESGSNGILVAQDGQVAVAIADALAAVLTDAGDRMARAARATVLERYSSDRCLAGFLAIYERLVARPT